jgi:hypothetical protein
MVKNGKLSGPIIPPETSLYKFNNVEIGETLDLQLISLTNHPIAKYTEMHNNPALIREEAKKIIHPDYPNCKVGPILTIKYNELVKPAIKIWTEKVTGYSAMVAYKTSNSLIFFSFLSRIRQK